MVTKSQATKSQVAESQLGINTIIGQNSVVQMQFRQHVMVTSVVQNVWTGNVTINWGDWSYVR